MRITYYHILCLFLISTQYIFASNHINNEISIVEEKLYFYPLQGEKMLDSLLSSLEKDKLEKYQGQLNFLSGVLAYKKGESDSALVYLEKALITFVNDDDKLYQAKAQLILGWLAEKIGYWQQSKINYYKVIELVDEKNLREQGLAYLGIARCKHYLRESKGNELQIGTELLNAIGKKEYSLYAKFLKLVINKSNNETPFELLTIAKEYTEMGLHTNAASTYKGLSTYYRKQQDWFSALKYIDEALALNISKYPSASLLPSLNQHKGLIYFYQKDYSSAIRYLNKSLTLSNDYGQPHVKYYSHRTLCKIDTLMGDYKSALNHLSKAVASNRANDQKGEKQLAKLMEISLNLKMLQEENSRLKSLRNIIVLSALCILLIFVIVFLIVHQKQKLINRKKIEKEKEKKRALHALMVGLGEKRLLKKVNEEIISDINKGIKYETKTDSTLLEDFEECYFESIKNIETHFPQLTKSDAIYGLMFSLNLPNDVISEIKNINPESIRKIKLRMRKKLNLGRGYDLGNYFTCSLSSVDKFID